MNDILDEIEDQRIVKIKPKNLKKKPKEKPLGNPIGKKIPKPAPTPKKYYKSNPVVENFAENDRAVGSETTKLEKGVSIKKKTDLRETMILRIDSSDMMEPVSAPVFVLNDYDQRLVSPDQRKGSDIEFIADMYENKNFQQTANNGNNPMREIWGTVQNPLSDSAGYKF
jgi:hypothetical protein